MCVCQVCGPFGCILVVRFVIWNLQLISLSLPLLRFPGKLCMVYLFIFLFTILGHDHSDNTLPTTIFTFNQQKTSLLGVLISMVFYIGYTR